MKLWAKRSRFDETRRERCCRVLANHEVAFRHLRTSPTSSTCLLQFPFEYVTLKDKQAYIGDYNSKKVF